MPWYEEISQQVEEIYAESHAAFSTFQEQSGLTCLTGCGACCLNQNISATLIEMLPTAKRLYDEGLAEETLFRLEQLEDRTCIFYKKLSEDGKKGFCTNYSTRPSVCRSFGAASVLDKNGQKRMSVCKLIKEAHPHEMAKTDPLLAPVIGEFASRVMMLFPVWNQELMPINQALKEALERILIANLYQDSRD